MSSQSERNRSCPGVPNRYSTTPPGRLIRPKSMATVVVVLSRTPARSSTAADASVRCSSVCSGVISETESISVVLPTPKGPATRILTSSRAVSGRCGPLPGWRRPLVLEGAEAIGHSLQQVGIGQFGGGHRRPADDQAAVEQLVGQDPDRGHRQLQQGGTLHDGQRAPAE